MAAIATLQGQNARFVRRGVQSPARIFAAQDHNRTRQRDGILKGAARKARGHSKLPIPERPRKHKRSTWVDSGRRGEKEAKKRPDRCESDRKSTRLNSSHV